MDRKKASSYRLQEPHMGKDHCHRIQTQMTITFMKLLSRFQCNRGKSQLGLDNQVEVCNITLRGSAMLHI